jgi:hypothetical protein
MYSTTIDYLGKRFDIDYEVNPDHNGDDEFTIESIMWGGEDWCDFMQCVQVEYRHLPHYPLLMETAFEALTRMVGDQHKELEEEYDSMTVEGE